MQVLPDPNFRGKAHFQILSSACQSLLLAKFIFVAVDPRCCGKAAATIVTIPGWLTADADIESVWLDYGSKYRNEQTRETRHGLLTLQCA